jgi:hypothetical protein
MAEDQDVEIVHSSSDSDISEIIVLPTKGYGSQRTVKQVKTIRETVKRKREDKDLDLGDLEPTNDLSSDRNNKSKVMSIFNLLRIRSGHSNCD